MKQCKRRNWAASTAVVASITAAAVLGTAVPASASTGTAPTSSAAVKQSAVSSARSVGGVSVPAGIASAGTAPRTQGGVETRSWGTIIRTAINALKKVPALWKKVVDGVKKSYATFKSKVWPAIKATVGAISTLITAWDIWKYFN